MTQKAEEEIGLFTFGEAIGNKNSTLIELLDAPKRRDIKGLKSKLNDIIETDKVTILYDSQRYGTNIIQGSVRLSNVGEVDNWHVGGINLAKKSAKNTLDPADINVKKIIDNIELFPQTVEIEDIHQMNHGDLVLIEFTTLFYGKFSILGILLAGEKDDLLLVNKWLVYSSQGLNPSISKLMKIADSNNHDLEIPTLRQPLTIEEGEDT